jgi:WD40 repeat protein
MIRISIAEAGKSPQLLTYNASAITLGRLAEHDLCLTGKGVSATHCRIVREGDAYFVEDLGSTNGTYVNRQRVQGRQPIGPTDDVVLAIYRLRVLADAESGASAMPMAGPLPVQPPWFGSGEGPMVATPGVRHAAPTAHVPPPTGSMPGPGQGPGPMPLSRPGSGAMPMHGSGPSNPSLAPVGPLRGSGPSNPSLAPVGPLVSSGAAPVMSSGAGPLVSSGAAPVMGPSGRAPTSSGIGPSAAEMAWGREWEQIDKLSTAWLASGKNSSELLRGDKLAHARKWLAQGRGKRPPPKPLHRDFINAGARGKVLRGLGGMMFGALVLGGLGVGGWYLWQRTLPDEPEDGGTVAALVDVGGGAGPKPEAVDPGNAEASAALVAKAEELFEDPVLAVLLAAEAVVLLPKDEITLDARAFTVLRAALRDLPGRPLRDHAGAVERVALSPDGRWAITAGVGGSDVHLWDLDKAGVPSPSSLNGHPSGLTGMQVSEDGRWLVTADADGLAMRWNLLDPDPASTSVRLEDHRLPISALDMSADGHWLVTGDEGGQVKVWDLDLPLPSAFTLPRGHAGKVTGVAMNATGTRVVSSGEDMTARNWKLSEGRGKNPVVVPHEEVVVTSVALTSDDHWAVTGGAEGVVRLWPPTTKVPTLRWELLPGHKGAVERIEVSADSSMAVSVAQDNDLWIWDLLAKVPSASSVKLSGHTGRITQLTLYSPPTGVPARRHVPTTAFTASADGTARSWDLDQRKLGTVSRVFPGHDGGVSSVAVSGDGQWAITGGADRLARVWDWQSLPASAGPTEGEMLRMGSASRVGRAHTAEVVAVAVDPFGRRMITGSADGTARLWNLRHRTRLVSLPFKDLHTDRVRAVAVSADNQWAASADNAGGLVLWKDFQDDSPPGMALAGHSGEIGAVAFTPDGKRLISVSTTDRTARVWKVGEDPASDVVVLQHDDELIQLAIGGDGKWLLTGTLTSALLWDLQGALDAPTQVFKGHEDDLKVVALDALGRWAATGSGDLRVLLYDLKKGGNKPIAKLRKHEGTIQVLAFHPEGRWLASGSADKTIRLWDLQSAHPEEGSLALAGHDGTISDLEWSADGRWLVSASNDGTIRLWDSSKPHVEMVEEAIVLEGHGKLVPQVALVSGPRGLSHVISVSYDGTARLWPLVPDELVELACTAAGRRLTEDEWAEHVAEHAGVKYATACK